MTNVTVWININSNTLFQLDSTDDIKQWRYYPRISPCIKLASQIHRTKKYLLKKYVERREEYLWRDFKKEIGREQNVQNFIKYDQKCMNLSHGKSLRTLFFLIDIDIIIRYKHQPQEHTINIIITVSLMLG